MTALLVVAYVLVGIGVCSGRRQVGDGWAKSLAVAVAWPVLALVAVGRNIA